MAKIRIMLDLDGCLADFYGGFASYLNKHWGTTLDPHREPTNYSFNDWGCGVDRVNVEEATDAWILDGGYRKLPIFDGALDFFNQLDNLYKVYLVTARVGEFGGRLNPQVEKVVRDDTIRWCKNNGLKTTSIFFDHDKIDFCSSNGIGIMIEDKLSTAIAGSKKAINTILIDRGWNQSPQRFRVFRAHSYPQALDILNKFVVKR